MKDRSFTLQQLAELTGAQPIGDLQYSINNVEALESATPSDVSFLANPRYRMAMLQSKAGIICVDPTTPLEPEKNYLVSSHPSTTFQSIAEQFLITPLHYSGFSGIHPTAVIHPEANVSPLAHIGPYAVVDLGAQIGEHTRLFPHVYVGARAKIGSHCLLHSHSTVREGCMLGDRVILQPGAIIGSCGFGFITSGDGRHTKLEQLGVVILENDVEVGANTTIDRARFKVTRIGQGTKIDNLVQIGHNVSLGPHNIIVAQTGIAGSAKTGHNVVLGAQGGVVGHVEIASGVMVTARGGISKSITRAGKYAGTPTMELSDYNRQQVHLRKISHYVKKIEELEKRLAALEHPAPSTRA